MATATVNGQRKPLSVPDGDEHELVLVRRGPRTGAHIIIAVHSTVLGPALGGCRLWRYENLQEAVSDALRLSGAMTLKAAAAQLQLGGGKAVIFPPAGLDLTESFTRSAARGLRRQPEHARRHLHHRRGRRHGRGRHGLPLAALRARRRGADRPRGQRRPGRVHRNGGARGDPGLLALGLRHAPASTGRSVAIVGLGHVGEPLARALAKAGAELVLADVDPAKRALAAELRAAWLDPEDALHAHVDLLAPCALGGVIDQTLSLELSSRIVCGSANNQLAAPELAGVLAARGVLYAPDFIVNSGGLINVGMELTGYDRDRALERIRRIEDVLGAILDRAQVAGVTPLAAAERLAAERIAAGAAAGPGSRGAP